MWSQVLASYNKFKQDLAGGADVANLQQQLLALKLSLAQHGLLQASDDESRAIARGVLEQGALFAIKTRDLAAFERSVTQLQQLYSGPGGESPFKYEILGLNLLRLLAVDKRAEFHMQLELVPVAKRSDRHIQYPVALEQHMMEGTYHKVIGAASSAPSPWCSFFVHLLSETVRMQIAESFSRAYASLSPANAVELLMLSNAAELAQYEKQFDWKRGPGGNLVFGGKGNNQETRVPRVQVMEQTLVLAEELERIV